MHTPIVSVVIVSYNTRDLTVNAIKSVISSKGFKKGQIEVIVVDNNSSDDTVDYIGRFITDFRLIVNQTNLGFGAANNQGAAAARGEYLLLLNSDAILSRDSLSTLVKYLKKHPKTISVGPQLVSEDGNLQQSAGYFPLPSRIIGWMWGLDKVPIIKNIFSTPYHIFDLYWYKKSHAPDWLMAACVLFRTPEFLGVGGFDENIFMYGEEVELYLRLKTQFHKNIHFTPKTSTAHLGHGSSPGGSAAALVSELRGILYIYTKHFPDKLWFIRFILYTGVVLRLIIFSFMPSRRAAVLEYKKFLKNNS